MDAPGFRTRETTEGAVQRTRNLASLRPGGTHRTIRFFFPREELSELEVQARNLKWSVAQVVIPFVGFSRASSLGRSAESRGWLKFVKGAETEEDLSALRRSVNRGNPFGDAIWTEEIVSKVRPETTLSPRSQPKTPNNGS